ncbi:MAG: alanine--glyoxylate aminotransferase family protein [Chloroflexi bacterium]|nr:alanine--glyoxylate aminotransferase family protein [Chloroflexota bacterium]
MNLRIPGPTPLPAEVLEAEARPMVNHRGAEFARILERVTARLKESFRTKGDVLLLTASGSGGLESAIVNTLSPGDPVLAVTVGAFGDRFAAIAEAYGTRLTRLEVPWGEAADPEAVRAALKKHPETVAVLVTHNETSTGVTNPLKEIAAAVKGAGKLLLVDGVSSLGSLPCPVDEWGLDVAVTASQKGWMAPPGLAMVSVSPEAWKAHEKAKMPRVYFDYKEARSYAERGQTPWTPAVSVFYALDAALEMMVRQGLDNFHARHAWAGDRVRQRVKEMGLQLFPAQERYASNTVTAIRVPASVDDKRLRRIMLERYGVEIASGQERLNGQIIRIGHMGFFTDADIEATLDALASALNEIGFRPVGASRA